MRRLAVDFDLTLLLPLMLVAVAVLWNAVRRYMEARSSYNASLKRMELPFSTHEEEDELLEWGIQRCADWRKAKNFLWLPSFAFVVLCALMLVPDEFKVAIAESLWAGLGAVSAIAFITCIPVSWHYAKELNWLKLGICLLVMLLAAASAEHSFNQKFNARHATCPHCSDDDDQSDDR